ncbi:hypothetical protein QE152_g6162 [Popillia japonica]|uniref:Uncharacterized protein n=1 Tax=Popillia japonica TaxID=7064 RepID=A0AAW1MLV5_POPJA
MDRIHTQNFTRMSAEDFEKLICLVGRRIAKRDTKFRKCIPVQDRLAIFRIRGDVLTRRIWLCTFGLFGSFGAKCSSQYAPLDELHKKCSYTLHEDDRPASENKEEATTNLGNYKIQKKRKECKVRDKIKEHVNIKEEIKIKSPDL